MKLFLVTNYTTPPRVATWLEQTCTCVTIFKLINYSLCISMFLHVALGVACPLMLHASKYLNTILSTHHVHNMHDR